MKGDAVFIVGSKKVHLTADEAQAQAITRGMCRECGKEVRLHRRGKNGRPAAHFEHLVHKKSECSLSDQGYE
jgi:hypothetical protein